MLIRRGYKTELDPNNVQRGWLGRCAGAARFVYNWALQDHEERYRVGEKVNVFEQKRRFNAIKSEQFPWLYDVPYTLQEQAFRNLDAGWQNYFRSLKNGQDWKRPKFKKRGQGSFTLRGCIYVEQDRVKLPRIGWINLKERGYIPVDGEVKLLSVNISERAGRWFLSAQVEQEISERTMPGKKAIGIDLGIKALAVCSDGTVFENPRSLEVALRKLSRLQRELARRTKGGANWKKTKEQMQRIHARVASIRCYTQHEVSHYVTVTKRPSAIVIEDLNVKGMLANHHIARALSDTGMGEVARQIRYKAEWNGIDVVTAGRFYPSSKTCLACGMVKPLLRLSDRTFVCESCGTIIDRDLNAARNLASLAV